MSEIDFGKAYVKKLFLWLNLGAAGSLLVGYFLLIGSPFFVDQNKSLGRYLSLLATFGLGNFAISASKVLEADKDVFKVVLRSERELHIDRVATDYMEKKQGLQQLQSPPELPPELPPPEVAVSSLEAELNAISEDFGSNPNDIGLALLQLQSGVSKTEILESTLGMGGSKWSKGEELLSRIQQIRT